MSGIALFAMSKHSLSWLMVRYMSLVTLTAFVTMVVGASTYLLVLVWHHSWDGSHTDWSLQDIYVLVGILIAGLIPATLIGWKLAQRLIAPIQDMARAADLIAHGNFEARVSPIGSRLGELGELGDNFNKMGELLERARSDLTYENSAIAHELRTPLTILKGRLIGLRDGVFTPDDALYTSLIGQVDSLTRIVDDLRTLALFEAGRLTLRLEPFDVSDEIRAVVNDMEGEFGQASLSVSTELVSGYVLADRLRIRQALTAVLHNACRYAPSGTVRIKSRIKNSSIEIEIADTGPGLPDKEIGLIFQRFWRADDSRGRASGGTGLGLSIVKAILEAHDGSVSAATNRHEGLSIILSLPLVRS